MNKNKIKKDINYLCNTENYSYIYNQLYNTSVYTYTMLSSTNTFHRTTNGNLEFTSYSKTHDIHVELHQDKIILCIICAFSSNIEHQVIIKYNCTEEEFFQISTMFNMFWFEYKLIKEFEKIKNIFIKERE